MFLGKLYSYFLVTLQFFLILLIILYSSFKNYISFPFLIFLIGMLISIWAIFTMRRSKLRITPDVAKNAKLVKGGPYKYIRHPMYASVLIVCLGLILSNFYSFTITLYFLLFVTLFFKISYEEKLLEKNFLEYKKYKSTTKRIIPYIY